MPVQSAASAGRLRIAYVIENGGIFGGVRIVAEHLNRLTERGHFAALILKENAPINWLPGLRFPQYWAGSMPVDPASFDVVVGTGLSTWEQAAGKDFGKARRFALVQMLDHLFHPAADHKGMLPRYKLPLRFITISKWLTREVAKLSGQGPERVFQINNGIDLNLFYPDNMLPRDPDRLRIVIEGHTMNLAKDGEEMMYKAALAAKTRYGSDIEIIGFSQFPPRREFDRFWYRPDQNKIREIYSAGDIFLKASVLEGNPGPHFEAMACGFAAVCTAINEGDDDLHHEENCLKVRYGDQEGFEANMFRLIEGANLRRALAANALTWVQQHKRWDGVIDRLETIYGGQE